MASAASHFQLKLYVRRTQLFAIAAAANPLKEATEAMYEAIEERINLLAAKNSYPGRHLILMGGILINGDRDMGSCNSCRRFEVIGLASGKSSDLLDLMNA